MIGSIINLGHTVKCASGEENLPDTFFEWFIGEGEPANRQWRA